MEDNSQKNPILQAVEPGKYAWCSCGLSKKQPLCDGSHQGTGMTPVIVTIEEKKNVAWCGCKRSQKKPFCDGTHSSL